MSEDGPIVYDSKEGPEELAGIWDDEIKTAFSDLREKQQKFLLAYVRFGSGAEAYRKVYNSQATPTLAASCGSQVLLSKGIQGILRRLSNTRLEDLMLVKATFKEAAERAVKPVFSKDKDGQPEHVEDIPDSDVRVKAADKLARLNKFYDEDEVDPENPDKPASSKKVISFGGVKIEVS